MNCAKSILIALMLVISVYALSAQSNTLQKADKYYELFAFQSAADLYEVALKEFPNNFDAMIRIADCYRHLQQLNNAEKWYRKIVVSPVKEDVDIFLYATILKAQGKYGEAKNWFLKYAETNLPVGSHYASSCDFAINNADRVSDFEVEREYVINSPHSEFAPTIYKDALLFSAFNSIDNNSNQLYIAQLGTGNNLLEPKILKQGIKSSTNEGYTSFGAYNRTVAFVKNNNNFSNGIMPMIGSGVKMNIYFGDVVNASIWENISAFPYNEAEFSNGYPYLTDDGRKLFFASNRPGGYGGFDIYSSSKIGDAWSEPKNLGSIINTAGNEISPFLDGTSLYFASDWQLGYGGFDLFKTEKKGNYSWSPIRNLGPQVNSSANDFDLIFDKSTDTGYFVSNRSGGKGKDDLFKVTKLTSPKIITVNIYGAESNKPIKGVTIDLSNCDYGLIKTNEYGVATIPDFKEAECEAIVQKIGFSDKKILLKPNIENEEMAFYIKPLKSYFIGQIKNSETEDMVSGVAVKLLNDKGAIIEKVITDSKGRYTLNLNPNSTYKIVCSKIGFVSKDLKIKTKDKINEDFLASIELEPTPFVDIDESVVVASVTDIQTTKVAPTPADWRESGDLVAKGVPAPKVEELMPTSSSLSTNNGVLTTEEPIAEEHILVSTSPTSFANGEDVYEVQIGAFSKPNYKKLASLGDIGLVYSDRKEDLFLYKVGTFKTQEEAVVALKKIKDRGYKDAFVRKILNFNPIVSAINNISEKEKTHVVPAPGPIVYESPVIGNNKPVFKVQLGAFKNSTEVNFSDLLNRAGQIYSITDDSGVTVYLLGDFYTLDEARSAKNIVQLEGVPSPFIVAYKDGKKISVKEALGN